jgi:uncharacterized repeat protein (TIGR01451 family)
VSLNGNSFNNSGTMNVSGGTFSANGGGNSTGAFTASTPGTMQFGGGTHDLTAASSVTGDGTVGFSAGTTNLAGGYAVTGTTRINGGTANFNGATPSTVGLDLSGGTLGGSSGFTVSGAANWTGGTMAGTGSTTVSSPLTINAPGVVNLQRLLTLNGTGTWQAGRIDSNNGTFTNAGTFTSNLSNSFECFGGTCTVNNSGTWNHTGGTVSLNGNSFNNSGTVNITGGALNFNFSFTQTAGSTTLNGGNMGGGVTFNFNGGTLGGVGTITGNVNNSGATVNPGLSPGTLNITSNYTQGAGGSLNIELGGTGAGQFDVLAMGGTASLNGTLNVISFGGFTPAVGDAFQVMTYTSASNDFTTKNGLNISTPPLTASRQATFYLLQVTAPADLVVTKADSPDPVNAGQSLTYTVTVTNNGPATATGIVLTDTLPANTTFVSATPSQGTCPAPVGGVLTCNLGTLLLNGSATVTIVVTPSSAAVPSITNTVSATATETDPTPANNTNISETTTVNPSADLTLTKTDSPDPVRVGNNLTYTLTVTNNGPNAATGVTLTDTLPANVTFVSSTPGAPTCTEAGGVVTCNLGTINSGANSVVTIVVTPQAAAVGTINNTASVSANEFDPVAADNSATQSTTVDPVADLTLSKTDSPDPVQVGSNLTYTLTVTNNGPNDATGVTLTDTLPANVTFVSTTPAGPTCSQAAGVVTCNLGTIANGANSVVTIVVTPQAAAVPSITNTASVTSAVFDPNSGNNTNITQTTTVTAVADVSITISDSPDPVNAGANITYTVTVSNAGPSAATNIVATAAVPAGLTFVSATATQGTCSFAAGTLTCNVGTLASGASATATVVLTAGAAAVPSVSVTANVTATETDSNAANNSATATTAVNPAADLAVTKSDSPDPVVVGNNVTYTVTVANNGPSQATAVVLTDNLPGAVTFVSATPSQGTCSAPVAGGFTCDLGSINAGSNATVTVVVTAPGTPGSITNNVSVTSGVTDPVAGNNSASATTTVNPVVTADFSLTATPPVQNVPAGLPAEFIVTATSQGGFAGNVAFTCSGAPPLSTCTITPAQVAVNATTPGVATVVIATRFGGPPTTNNSQAPPMSLDVRLLPLLAGMLMMIAFVSRRRLTLRHAWVGRLAPVVLILLLAVFASSCVPTSTVSTPSGTYTITIQATSGSLTHSTTLTLIVR